MQKYNLGNYKNSFFNNKQYTKQYFIKKKKLKTAREKKRGLSILNNFLIFYAISNQFSQKFVFFVFFLSLLLPF